MTVIYATPVDTKASPGGTFAFNRGSVQYNGGGFFDGNSQFLWQESDGGKFILSDTTLSNEFVLFVDGSNAHLQSDVGNMVFTSDNHFDFLFGSRIISNSAGIGSGIEGWMAHDGNHLEFNEEGGSGAAPRPSTFRFSQEAAYLWLEGAVGPAIIEIKGGNEATLRFTDDSVINQVGDIRFTDDTWDWILRDDDFSQDGVVKFSISPTGEATFNSAFQFPNVDGTLNQILVTNGTGDVDWADVTALGVVPTTRTLTAGAGMTGGGDLSADRTFDVVANADGSITVNADDIQVGVLATDAQHGVRGGGTQHALASTLTAGFLSAADKQLIDDLGTTYVTIGAPDQTITSTKTFNPNGDGVLGNNDVIIGDSTDYGLARIGQSVYGRTSFNVGALDLDGVVFTQQLVAPATSNMEFVWFDSGTDIRFALAKSAAGNATLNPRSMFIAGPAIADDTIVTLAYWQGTGIFDNLTADTDVNGSDLGVQNDLEVEGIIYTDDIQASTAGFVTVSRPTAGSVDLNVDSSGANNANLSIRRDGAAATSLTHTITASEARINVGASIGNYIINSAQSAVNTVIRTPADTQAFTVSQANDNVGIGGFADPSAKLSITSTTMGFLPPRMTEVQRDAITAVQGLMIYNTDSNTIEHFDGVSWVAEVDETRVLTAGAGLTGGGDLSADRTFDVVANADGSIVVNADDIQVGVLATDAQHGTRGGGTLHAAATDTVQGFIELATQAEVDAGTDNTRAVTPLTLSNTSSLDNDYVTIATDQTVTGEKTFNDPIIGGTTLGTVLSSVTFQRTTTGKTQLTILSNGAQDADIRLTRGSDGNAFYEISQKSANVQERYLSSNTTHFHNTTKLDVDQIFRGSTDNDLLKIDAGLDAVGISAPTINAVAIFQIDSTTKGFLPPRMDTTQRDAISSPPAGLMIYNTTTNTMQFYNGSVWGNI